MSGLSGLAGKTAQSSESQDAAQEQPDSQESPESVPESDESTSSDRVAIKTYSCHPIQRYQIGRFLFENSKLSFYNEADLEEFEKLLDGQPANIKRDFRELSLAKAEEIAAQFQSTRMTRGIETAGGDENAQLG